MAADKDVSLHPFVCGTVERVSRSPGSNLYSLTRVYRAYPRQETLRAPHKATVGRARNVGRVRKTWNAARYLCVDACTCVYIHIYVLLKSTEETESSRIRATREREMTRMLEDYDIIIQVWIKAKKLISTFSHDSLNLIFCCLLKSRNTFAIK